MGISRTFETPAGDLVITLSCPQLDPADGRWVCGWSLLQPPPRETYRSESVGVDSLHALLSALESVVALLDLLRHDTEITWLGGADLGIPFGLLANRFRPDQDTA